MVDKVETVGYVPRLMNESRRYTAVIVGITLVLALLIFTDWLPFLRGPRPDSEVWHWVYEIRPFSRWRLVGLATLLLGGLSGWWLVATHTITPFRTAVFLILLAIAVFFLQMSLVYADRGLVYAELIDRALAVQTNGYFWHAAQVTDISQTLSNYPQLMTTFESDHVRTHPPGLLWANWLTIRLAENTAVVDPLSPIVQHNRCTDLWLLDSPASISSALGVWAILPALLVATAVFPAYLIGYTLTLNRRHAIIGATFVAVIPSLLIFTPTPDQISSTFTLWLIWLALLAIRRQQLLLFFLAGVLFSVLSFISLGNVGLVILLSFLPFLYQPRKNWLPFGFAFAIGGASVWLIYGLGWGVLPWDIAMAGLAEHEQLVLVNRSYSTWLLFNGIDLITFLGLPILIGFITTLLSNATQISQSVRQVGIATAVLLILLNFSGSARGEVGRIWLFIFPIMAIIAGLFYARKLSVRQIVWVTWSQLLIVVAVGLAWQPIGATIVVAERPYIQESTPDTPMSIDFEQGIQLTGTSIQENENAIDVTLYWQSEGRVKRPYTVFNQLLDPENNLIAQKDGWSLNGQWPTSCWEKGEIVIDSFTIDLPDGLVAGQYQLFTGLYDARDLTRLSVVGSGETAVFLTTIHIK